MHLIWYTQVEPGQAGWWKFREREETIKTRERRSAYRNSAWSPGWHSRWLRDLLEVFVLDISCSRHLCLMLPLSLDPACSWHFWILTAVLVDSSGARDLTHSSLATSFFWCHRCLLKPMSFQPLSVDVSFSWHPYLWASLFFETCFSWHSLLSTSHSLDTVFAWHHFSCFLLFHTFILRPLSVKIVSFDTFCLDISFVLRQFFILESLSFDIFLPCEFILCTTRLAQSPSCTTKYLPNVFSSTTSYYKAAQKTSQYHFVLQSLHKVRPSTTS